MTIVDGKLREHLRDFAGRHPHGWAHHDWLGLLSELSESGLDTGDAESIGSMLEEERLEAVLAGLGVRGLGPKRRQLVVDRFKRLWDLHQASVEELAELPSFHKGLAAALHEALR